MTSLNILYVVYLISIIIYIITVFLDVAFVLPLQAKEARIKNGLTLLRKQLLLRGIVGILVALASISALASRYFPANTEVIRYIALFFVLVSALGSLVKAIIDYMIYHQQYSDESIKRHQKIAKLEKRFDK